MEEFAENFAAPEAFLGAEIDGYRLEAFIGSGSYGVVYLARHLLMDRLFAFKILQAEFSNNEEAVREFFHECKMAAKLEHPHVVQACQAGRTPEGLCYFVMEYVEGSSVEDIRVNTPEELSLEFLLELSIQLAGALDYAWNARQIIHRDIKPGNLLVRSADRQLKLADLGLAGVGGAAASGDIVATPLYMAPEVAAGRGSSSMVSDIYSFGVMFFELSSGIPPFVGSIEELQQAHLYSEPPSLLEANPDLDPELARYIDSMLAKDMSARPQSWGEVRDRLSAIKERLYSQVDTPLVQIDASEFDGAAAEEKKTPFWGNWYIVAVVIGVFLAVLAVMLFKGF